MTRKVSKHNFIYTLGVYATWLNKKLENCWKQPRECSAIASKCTDWVEGVLKTTFSKFVQISDSVKNG